MNIQDLSRKSPNTISKNDLQDTDVTWKPRGMDWNVHA